ncbi:hypothetical protein DPMN_070474 [Dreissena polymorpha]|uniref:Uncharacterized protein n=1 Tax=Dreissena polymorpha TaxID=45954 RepID=A0A9D3Z5D4_DREPO|nr:hypothetical protein DPMN_070474 [Dreissena polymorpha]
MAESVGCLIIGKAVAYDKVLMEKMFLQAVVTVLQEDNIRHRLRPVLTPAVSEVLRSLNEITLNEMVHSSKTKTTVGAIKAEEHRAVKALQERVEELKGYVLHMRDSNSQADIHEKNSNTV